MNQYFVDSNKTMYKSLLYKDGYWLIDYNKPTTPFCVLDLSDMKQTIAPLQTTKQIGNSKNTAWNKRIDIIMSLINDERCIWDNNYRREKIKEKATRYDYTTRTIREMYYKVLAQGYDSLRTKQTKRQIKNGIDQKNCRWAINKYYYSLYRMSLSKAYTMMIAEKYTIDGMIIKQHPTYSQFYYYFRTYIKNDLKKEISQNGFNNYKKNLRPIFGKAEHEITGIGTYQMDATDADIHLVSKYNRNQPIGRPKIYVAVDVFSRLITGIYVGLVGDENAVMECLKQAAGDKVEYCAKYGISIKPSDWVSYGLPSHIITDNGTEFVGERMNEFYLRSGVVGVATEAYRPDQKGVVENSIKKIQDSFKSFLRFNGVVDKNNVDIDVPSYIKQATLTLDEFTAIVIYCVLQINNQRVLKQYGRIQEMSEANVAPIPTEIWNWCKDNYKSSIIPVSKQEIQSLFLPIADAKMTRKGIKFKGLYYFAKGYNSQFANAGISGTKNVKIAYDICNTKVIYLIDKEKYIPFVLTPAKEQYNGCSYEEIDRFIKSERNSVKQYQTQELEGSIKCIASIREIVQNAIQAKEKDITCVDVKNRNIYREREKEQI